MNRYFEIYLDLEEDIVKKKYPAGTKLPSEKKLSEHYGVSRETIRKALVLLAEKGYIHKQQGKGSTVLDLPKVNFPISGLTSYKEIFAENHIDNRTIVVSLEKKTKYDKERKNEFFPFSDEELWVLVRQREVNGEVVILDKDYLLVELTRGLTKEIAENSIYEYFEEELNMDIGFAKKEVTVEPLTDYDRKYLTLRPEDNHVVVVRSQVYLQDTQLFQYTESRHRVDKFKFIDFARRKKITP
ncbi:trehalose operon repressor [Peptostreptococcus faecalis]|uniref:trehalose operon repressor n=1 Tax=Peptostreptococcus faecalis TaxID=2045015 RepID=UPI000C7B63EB|nr:trehalose operon repressor [Peptostreptococcus faecalis]